AEIRTLTGHTSPVNAVAVTPDGTRVISGASDNTVRVWNLATGKEIQRFNGHNLPVVAVAVTPDGKRVISAAFDNTVKVWNSATGTEILTFNGHSFTLVALGITPDGNKVVLASISIAKINSIIQVLDLETGQEELTIKCHRDIVRTVAITSDNRLISGGDRGTIKVWSLETGKVLSKLDPFKNSEIREKLYAITGQVISKLDPFKNSETTMKELDAIAVAPDGKSLIAVYSDNLLRVWNLETSNKSDQVKFHFQLEGHTDTIVALAFTPDGKRFISASNDKTIKVWNLGLEKNNTHVINHNKSVNEVSITTDGKQVIFVLEDNIVTVYNFEKNTKIIKLYNEYPYRLSGIQHRFVATIEKIFEWWIKALTINLNYILLSLGVTLHLIFQDYLSSGRRFYSYLDFIWTSLCISLPFINNLFFLELIFVLSDLIQITQNYPNTYSNFKLDGSRRKIFTNKKNKSIALEKNRIIALCVIPYTSAILCVNKHLSLFNSCYFLTAWDLNKKTHKFDLRTTSQFIFIALCLLIPIASISLFVFLGKIIFIKLPLSWSWKLLIWLGLYLIPILVSFLAFVFYESLTTISITPDCNYVIAGSNKSTINVWYLETKKLCFVLKGHDCSNGDQEAHHAESVVEQ
ncbi:MAG: WD40 repeat domain-containing protein, partial [Moorea sp. SIO3C2]|nr:WD40 repeat domain-containing protein [Moorena sp. SIO3C2]